MPHQYKLAVLTSHPIQYQAPLWKKLATHPSIDLTVYYCTDFGVSEQLEPEFEVRYKWDVPLLDGYRYTFLRNYSPTPGLSFFGRINPGILLELWQNRYDAIFVHGHFAPTNLVAFWAAWLTRTPVFLRAIASNYYDSHVYRPKWLRALKRTYLEILYRHFISAFMSIGSRNTEFFLSYGVSPDRVFNCPYAVDNDFFIQRSDGYMSRREELRKAAGLGPKETVVLFASKLIEKKNPTHVLQAYERLADLPHKALVFVGDGRLRTELERYVASRELPRVLFVGFQNQKEVAKWYAITDIFVRCDSPDKGDWGATVNEALACSLPVVCADTIGSQADLVTPGTNGFVYSLGDIDRLAQILRELITEPAKLQSMRARCRDAVRGWSYTEDLLGILGALEAWSRKSRSRAESSSVSADLRR